MFILSNKSRVALNSLLTSVLFTSLSCLASDTSLGVNATVVASPCTVEASANQDVDLGSFYSNMLNSPGSTTDWANFTIDLSSCPTSTRSVDMTLSGEAEGTTKYFKNTGGSSTNVAIEITAQQAGATTLGPGDTFNVAVVQATHQASFPLRAHMISPQGGATSGTVSGAVEITFRYN
ncbi:fimbrial protein [Obesumbacterium proteus]|uniref:fimbrial protein n=1 Tax=Obesumbacterium proteus TaxID=82983 RepID=UPI002432D894|nr:fimbrial protein [Obesumbacterium proteus]